MERGDFTIDKFTKLIYSFSVVSLILGLLRLFYVPLVLVLTVVLFLILNRILPDREEKITFRRQDVLTGGLFFLIFFVYAFKYQYMFFQDAFCYHLPVSKYLMGHHFFIAYYPESLYYLIAYPSLHYSFGGIIYYFWNGISLLPFYAEPFICIFGTYLTLKAMTKSLSFALILFIIFLGLWYMPYIYQFHQEIPTLLSIFLLLFYQKEQKPLYVGMASAIGLLSKFNLVPIVGLYYLWNVRKIFKKEMLLSILFMAPALLWYLRNIYYFGNPVFPLLYNVIGYPEYAKLYTFQHILNGPHGGWNFLDFKSHTNVAVMAPLLVWMSYLILSSIKSRKIPFEGLVGIIMFISVFLFTPVTNYRYLMPSTICIVFFLINRIRFNEKLAFMFLILVTSFTLIQIATSRGNITGDYYRESIYISRNILSEKDVVFVNTDWGLFLDGKTVIQPIDMTRAEEFLGLKTWDDYERFFRKYNVTCYIQWMPGLLPEWDVIFDYIDKNPNYEMIYAANSVKVWRKRP